MVVKQEGRILFKRIITETKKSYITKSTTMIQKFLLAMIFCTGVGLIACGDGDDKKDSTSSTSESTTSTEGANPKGIGKYDKVELTHPLDEKMVSEGKVVYDVKCQSC